MQHRITISKYIKTQLLITVIGLLSLNFNAQEGIKIDGVAVVIGENIVLDSDISKFKREIELQSEGKVTISNCEMLERLMQEKLLAHHAIVDSVIVTNAEVDQRVERTVNFFIEQYGDVKKAVNAYGFNSLDDLKKELYNVQKENILVKREQQEITKKIDVTPEEVRLYFNSLKEKGEIPQFPAEIELAQIVIKAIPSKQENERVIAKLNEIKKQIEEGASFEMKAIINSDDPGVTSNGGKFTITKESGFIKEFKEKAFSLDVGQISKPFKTDFGYHIVQLHSLKGNARIISHILIRPEISDDKLKEIKEEAEKILKDIKNGEITFKEAAIKYSNDLKTKNNGGLISIPIEGSKMELTRLPPSLYARVKDLKKGEITDVFYDDIPEEGKMFKFVLMKDRTDSHKANLVKDYEKVKQLALEKKKQETIENWSKQKIKDTYIKIGKEYVGCNFQQNWKKEISSK